MTLQPVTFEKADLTTISQPDINGVIRLLVCLAAELSLDYDINTIQSHAQNLIARNLGELYLVRSCNDIVGVMGLVHNPEIWNVNKLVATEVCWYVEPAHRGLTGLKFIKYVESNLNCARIRLGVGNPLLHNMLQRQGYRCTKYIMEKDISHG